MRVKLPENLTLDDYTPSLVGIIICSECFHDWVGVAPATIKVANLTSFECPNCLKFSGYFQDGVASIVELLEPVH